MKAPAPGRTGKGSGRTGRTQKDRWVERVQTSLMDSPSLSTHKGPLFLQQTDYWIIRYQGHGGLLKSTRGLHYLAVLLRDPGREFHVSELLIRAVGRINSDCSNRRDWTRYGWTRCRRPSVGRTGKNGIQTPGERSTAGLDPSRTIQRSSAEDRSSE